MKKTVDNRMTGILLMLLCALIWSTVGMFIKLVPWNSVVLCGWRGFFAAAAILAYMLVTKMRIVVSRRALIITAANAVTSIMFIAATKLTTAANALVLQYTSPVFLVVLGMVFFRKRYRARDYVAVALTVGGVALFFLEELSGGGALGNAFAVVDGLSLAVVYLMSGESPENEMVTGIMLGNVICAVCCMPFTLVYHVSVTLPVLGLVAVMGAVQIALPFILYSKALKTCPPLACALICSVEILLCPVWVYLAVGEVPGKWTFIGGAVIFLTVTVWCAIGGGKPIESKPAESGELPAEAKL